MNPADIERLQTWVTEIAETLLPVGTRFHDEGGERKFHGQAGLWINLRSGLWFSFAANTGGAALQLIAQLKQVDAPDAIKWAEAWLAAHPGSGSCEAIHEEFGPASAAIVRDILDRLIDVTNTPAEAYLRSRKVETPFPDCVKFLQHARDGECAIVGILTSHGRITGIQVGFLDLDGRKTPLATKRKRYNLERAPDAAFEIPSPGENTTDAIVAEGLENALSIYRFAKRRCRIVGMPGIGTLRHLKFPPGTRVTVFRDSDPVASPAAAALQAGIDHLILNSGAAEVLITIKAPDGYDANRILTEFGVEEVALVLDRAEPATLSLNGEILKLAQLSELDYEKVRTQRARELGIRVGVLDDQVLKARVVAAAAAASVSGAADWEDVTEDEDVDLCEILDGILTQTKRYIIAPDTTLATAVLWAAFTHIVHHNLARVQVAPRLAIQAKTWGSGKTSLLEILSNLVHNPRPASSMTASTLLRSVEVNQPTILLDESQRILRRDRNDELVALCNASHRRKFAFVERSVPLPDGSWKVERFNIWCTMAMAGIGELLPEQQDRSIVIRLDKVLAKDVREQLEDGTSAELEGLHRKLEIWARRLQSLGRPPRPDCLAHQPGRVFDNWRPLIAIADLAGGQWPRLVQLAIAATLSVEHRLSMVERLLISIKKIFNTPTIDFEANKPASVERLETTALLESLLADPEEDWAQASFGRPITAYWLRDHLIGLLDPPKAQAWWTGATNARVKHKGYERLQFEKAWRVHLSGVEDDDDTLASGLGVSGASGASGASEQNQQDDRVAPSDAAFDDRVQTHAPAPDAPERSPDGETVYSMKSMGEPDAPDGAPDGETIYSMKSMGAPNEPGAPDNLNTRGDTPHDTLQAERSPEAEDLRPGHAPAHDRRMDGAVQQSQAADPVSKADPGTALPPSAPGSIAGEAKFLAAENPNWSIRRIAKHLGQPESRIAKYLPDHNPKPKRSAKPRIDPEVARVVEILRTSGPDGETASALYQKHSVYGQTLTKAADLGLIKNGGDRWNLA
jgi:Protein of unknown function (DUF3631)